ncbi:MAG: bis(5'-nucleosyl)-tetraphosphatase (symmetrical) YqeK [Candidatus Velthaea sp.]
MIATGLDFIRAAKRVRAHLGQDHRYAHVLRVARFAGALAVRHGDDPQRARVAGMLHDLARLYSGERLIIECSARRMPIDAFERANPVVLHARLGAELAREDFGVNDPAILSAIAKHTVAGAEMSRLDTIVYLADGLEPGRAFVHRAEFAEIAARDLDAAMRDVLQSTIAYLRSRNLPIAPQTLAAAKAFARPPHQLPKTPDQGGPAREVARGRAASISGQRPERLA